MKNIKFFFVLFLLFSFAFVLACGEKTPEQGNEGEKDPVEETETFTVSFETGTEVKIESQTVNKFERAKAPAEPTKEGFIFKGWFNGDKEFSFDTLIKEDVKLTAKWEEIKKFTVTFKVNDEVIHTETVKEGESATAPTAPEIEGATFIEWEGNFTNVTSDVVVVAVYQVNQYAVLFMVDGKDYGTPYEVNHGESVEAPADPVKEGYTFIGWDKEFTNVKQDLVINAKFEAIKYSIKYYSGTTEITTIEPKEYTVTDSIALSPYDLDGYGFMGWYTNGDYTGETVDAILTGSTGELKLYALNVKADVNGGELCWVTKAYDNAADAKNGIDAISNLPEMFEADFFKYLSDNNLLADSRINSAMQVKTWAEFSGLNPQHNGDPRRIWNDTSTNTSGAGDGYIAVFLFDTLTLNEDLTVASVEGGFLGTEPYKTKYAGLLSLLAILQNYKAVNGNYIKLDVSSNSARALCAFIIDGYFYGTQGVSEGYFAEGRNLIPGTDYGFKLSGTSLVKVMYDNNLPTPIKEGHVFAGWYLDQACTKKVGTEKAENLGTIYAKWEELK